MSLITSQYLPTIGGGKPSFFEIVAHEQILPGLKRATRYVLTLIVQRNYSLVHFLNYHDEIFLFFQLLTEMHYLENYQASFTEHLYNMKRASTTDKPPFLQKNSFSILFVILLPYLREKIHSRYTDWKERIEEDQARIDNFDGDNVGEFENVVYHDNAENPHNASGRNIYNENMGLNQGTGNILQSKGLLTNYFHYIRTLNLRIIHRLPLSKQRLKAFFLKYWPYLNGGIEAMFFIYLLGYLFDDWTYHSPIFHLQKLRLQRLTMEDIRTQKIMLIKKRVAQIVNLRNKRGLLFKIIEFAIRIGHKLSDYSRGLLLLLVFFFKFFEWYYASEHLRDSHKTIFIPEKPPAPPKCPDASNLPANNRLCPLCKDERKNPTLITKSGFVFCYKCILIHLKEKGTCPISQLPASETDLRRLFE